MGWIATPADSYIEVPTLSDASDCDSLFAEKNFQEVIKLKWGPEGEL